MPARNLSVLTLGALLLGGCSLTRPEEEPAYVKATAVEERVDRIENQNKALLDLQRQLEAVQAEVRHLRGEFEDFQHEAKAARDQQHDLYGDLDKRLTALDARVAAAGTGPAPPGAAAAAANDHDLYQAALDKLKSRDYAGAEHAFTAFISGFPQSPLVDNAEYWLGETYYVEKRFPEALGAFQRVVREHPDSRKVPDALLKAGLTQYEQKRYREARELFAKLMQDYADSAAAGEADKRLRRMDAEHR